MEKFLYYVEGEPSTFIKLGENFEYRFYAFAYLLAGISFFATIYFFWKRQGYSTTDYLAVINTIILTFIIGARLFYVLERLIYHPDNPFPNSAWWAVHHGGLSVQGGVLLPTIILLIWVHFHRDRIDWRIAASIVLPAVMLGLGIGRWGNFTNHEVFGKEVLPTHPSISWLPSVIKENMRIHALITDSNNGQTYIDPEARYYIPLFLYDCISWTIGYIVIVLVFNMFGWFKPGTTAAMFLVWFGVSRAIQEPYRYESYQFYSDVAWLLTLIGIVGIIYFECELQIKRIFIFRPRPRYRVEKRGYWYYYEPINPPVFHSRDPSETTRWVRLLNILRISSRRPRQQTPTTKLSESVDSISDESKDG